MVGDNLINREDSCKFGRPGEGSRNQESPPQIGRVGTFARVLLFCLEFPRVKQQTRNSKGFFKNVYPQTLVFRLLVE